MKKLKALIVLVAFISIKLLRTTLLLFYHRSSTLQFKTTNPIPRHCYMEKTLEVDNQTLHSSWNYFNPFPVHVPISYPLKTPENKRLLVFSGGYRMGTLAANGLISVFFFGDAVFPLAFHPKGIWFIDLGRSGSRRPVINWLLKR